MVDHNQYVEFNVYARIVRSRPNEVRFALEGKLKDVRTSPSGWEEINCKDGDFYFTSLEELAEPIAQNEVRRADPRVIFEPPKTMHKVSQFGIYGSELYRALTNEEQVELLTGIHDTLQG